MLSVASTHTEPKSSAIIAATGEKSGLGHAVGGQVERAYQRDDLLDERREVMVWWADYLTGAKFDLNDYSIRPGAA